MKVRPRGVMLIFFLFFFIFPNKFVASDKNSNITSVKTGTVLLFESLVKIETMSANFEHRQISNSGKTVVFKGALFFRRPDRLKWQLKEPYAQLQLVRGNQFLVYDPDLEQVIVKDLDGTLQSTPAGLLFASGPKAESFLREKYEIYDAPFKDSLKWVLVLPKFEKDKGVSALEIGLNEKAEIRRLVATDIFGKTSTIIFSDVVINSPVKDSEFIPIIPDHVEYIED